MKNKVIWHRWQDPLAPMVRGKRAKGWVPSQNEFNPDLHDALDSFGVDQSVNLPKRSAKSGQIGPCVIGPMGIVPIAEDNLPSSLFNFWMGDTNFHLTKRYKLRLERVAGVESLDIFTPYRFRIAIGRAFDEKTVKEAVEQSVQIAENIVQDDLLAVAAHKWPLYAEVTFPDGKRQFVGGNSTDEVLAKVKQFGENVKYKTSWRQQ